MPPATFSRKYLAGFVHRLADERPGRAVQDGVDALALEQGGHRGRVAVAADLEARAVRHRGAMAGREVVQDGHLVARGQEGLDR